MLDLPPATLNPRATHDPCRNLADYALREAVRSTAKKCLLIPREAAPSFRNDAAPLFRELLAP